MDVLRPGLANYRGLLLLQCAKFFGPPLLLAHLVTKTASLSPLAKAAVYLAAVPLVAAVRDKLDIWRNDREAARRGAKPVPRLKGKLPGNLDVMMYLVHEFENGYLLQAYQDLLDQNGVKTLNLRLMWSDLILCSDEGHVKYILTNGFPQWIKSDRFIRAFETFLGHGIFNRDEDLWKQQRAMARPFFGRDRVRDLELFDAHASEALRALRSSPLPPGASSVNERALDVQDLVGRFMVDSAADFLFGAQLDTLSRPLPVAGKAELGTKGSKTDDEFGDFVQAFEAAQLRCIERINERWMWPIGEFFGDKNKDPVRIVKAYIEPFVQKAVDEEKGRRERGEPFDSETANLLQYLASVSDDKIVIRDQLLNFLLAGRDTTAALLTFTIYLLSIHEDVFRKLRAEVLSAVGPDAMPDFETMRNMPYLRAVLNETLRLFPPVPTNQRGTTEGEGSVLPPTRPGDDPLYVPPSTDMFFFYIHFQRNSELWGEDAMEFVPERWIEKDKMKRYLENPMIFLPFHAGPRICLGQQLAYNEASFFMIRFLQQVESLELASEFVPKGAEVPADWKNAKGRMGMERVWPKTAITLYVKGGLWVRMKLRE
ncbi:cytochrome P450 [Exidia glandulosa HHB12029]|uniref:Cytochrome P450 n=1 Tax=Exidia glandulosa HHB12029 TaxID=1314781 RepID=A0A165E8B7_EXIGL|nr:cytochrome P450 [Exidia glandulosa HHB12029]